ncbi:MAG: RecQ family zinc-binding domain-containing protein [Trichocoleus desertorum ATA4-8-CV12]|jgi:ATP-dependent DNA helicase RecQ|nr:RecQ family zinc-binding domain-containing protein [Trichocoleus desertorum ATA4-8-CV12]
MAKQRKTKQQIQQIAQAQLGYEQLRPGQADAIAALLAGHDTLAVMPTGSGKSAIYQLAGSLIPGMVIEALGHPLVLALTAIAAPPVREEIVDRLGMQKAKVVVQGFDHPNIRLAVERYEDTGEKQEALLDRVVKAEKPGIVYVATRKRAEEVAAALEKQKVKAVVYHAGKSPQVREAAYHAFMDDEAEVIVATTAFGMGVDKPNVRFVFHYDISDSIDSYYQEIGRAGRDAESAQAVLFYNPVETLPTGEIVPNESAPDLEEAVEAAVRLQEHRQQYVRSRIEMMRGYAEVRDCRRRFVLNYFGEDLSEPCGFCDNCKSGIPNESETGHQPFAITSRVVHKSWGEGTVMRYEDDKITVLFETVGYKTLGVRMVLLRGLLKRVDTSVADFTLGN